jgi:hypothetical protein
VVEDALDEVLWTDPPIANYGSAYPVRDLDFHGVRPGPVVVLPAASGEEDATAGSPRAVVARRLIR